MNNEVKEKWINALTNNSEYKQTKRALKDDAGYCCLGVLCDLHAKETNQKWLDNCYLGNDMVLPLEVVEWAGFNQENLYAGNRKDSKGIQIKVNNSFYGLKALSQYNDEGSSFEEIAKIIEKEL